MLSVYESWLGCNGCAGEHDGTSYESIVLRRRSVVDGAVVAAQPFVMGDSGAPRGYQESIDAQAP